MFTGTAHSSINGRHQLAGYDEILHAEHRLNPEIDETHRKSPRRQGPCLR
ncbi:hypothetical protein FHX35_001162 [Auritidibacter ignavus]|nr:hypothetical protein [Auritidibacter ignavus]